MLRFSALLCVAFGLMQTDALRLGSRTGCSGSSRSSRSSSSRGSSSSSRALPRSRSRLSSALMMSSTVALTKDNGVVKEVVVPGQGQRIEAGDILAIEYKASVKGSNGGPFAKGDKEQFIVKDGSLIKGWDIAVESMRVGEKAVIQCAAPYAYGSRGVSSVIPPNADLELEIKVLAWLGNQLRPESLFQKDLDIDPFVASTPEAIQAEYEDMQSKKMDKYQGGIVQIYLNRLRNISFGFGGSNFFASQSGEKAPWYLNPNITFPSMIAILLGAFIVVLFSGSVREKGGGDIDLEIAQILSDALQNVMA